MQTPLDVNLATADELDAVEGLRGHGPEIVRYREDRGGFTDLRQLDEVPGMAQLTTPEILGRLTVSRRP